MKTRVDPLAVRLLGRFEVWRNGSQILENQWSRQKAKWLFTILLSQPGHVFSYDVLIEALFDHSDPDKALRSLYGLVSRLRRILEPDLDRAAESTFILRRGEGYCFNPDAPHSVDVRRFASLLRDAASLESMSRWGEARDRYEQAIDLYADGFLPENPYAEWTLEPRDRWAERHVQALAGLAGCQAATGDFIAAIETCRRIIACRPQDEAAHRKQMYYHYCVDEYDKAEEAFRNCVEALAKHLGVEPGPETLELHQEILERRAPRIARWIPNNLPHPLTSFIGRGKDIAELTQLVLENRLISLVGMGGIGKTRLAIRLGSELLNDFEDGVWIADLGAMTEGTQIPRAVAGVLGLRSEPGQSDVDVLLDRLQSRSLLLILDTCEPVIEDCAQFAETLLECCPNVHILATSRQELRVLGEVPRAVAPLNVPLSPGTDEEVARSDALRLFAERASAGTPGFVLSEENRESVSELVRRLDGIPLAIELAATQIHMAPMTAILDQLRSRSMLRDWDVRSSTERHRSLEATIDWTYRSLPEDEQATLRRIGVFAGGFEFDAAESVLPTERQDASSAAHSLSSLVQKSLLVFDATPGIQRYRLLDSVRSYAQARLAEAGEELDCRALHRSFFLTLAERAEHELRGPAQGEWFERLDRDLDNIRAALGWSLETGDVEEALRLASLLAEDYWRRLRREEGIGWLEKLLGSTGETIASESRAMALRGLASLRSEETEGSEEEYWQRATRELREAAALYLDTGNKLMHAKSRLTLANVEHATGRNKHAAALYEEVLVVYRELGNRSGEAACLGMLGTVRYRAGDHDAALRYYEQALSISREVGHIGKAQAILRFIGLAHEGRADYREAWDAYTRSLALARETGDLQAQLFTILELGTIGLREEGAHQGDVSAAREYWSLAMTLVERLRDDQRTAHVCMNYARFLCCEGEYAKAKVVLRRALEPVLGGTADPRIGEFCLMLLADVAHHEGDHELAALLIGATRAADPELLASWHRLRHERVMAALRGVHDDARIGDATAQGERTSVPDAVALALCRLA